jgi:hypothetical protein
MPLVSVMKWTRAGPAGSFSISAQFGLDQGDRVVRLVIEDDVGLLTLPARDELAAHDDAALGEIDLFADLSTGVPARLHNRRHDILRADVAPR